MKRTLVMSDIHGELEMFERLLSDVNYTPSQDQLILLGDYVDRGPDTKRVLDKVISLKQQGAIVLKGNHEDMMIKALTTDDERAWKNWVNRNGGSQTLCSYGFIESDFIIPDEEKFCKPVFQSEVMDKHLEFIQNLDHFYQLEDSIFFHAGVHPTTPLCDTDPYVLMWIREEFHNAYDGDKTVIFGHTPTKKLHIDENNDSIFFGKNNIIGIDGGAVYGGQLNCLELPNRTTYSVKLNINEVNKMEQKKYEELIPHRIFIGGVDAIEQMLEIEKIDVIFDLRAEVSGPLSSDISIHQPILDEAEKQDNSIKAAVSEVVEAYQAGKNIYFHCNTGRGRAGTIATATLLELGLATTVDEAEKMAKEIRPQINIKPQFKEALQRIYEKQ